MQCDAEGASCVNSRCLHIRQPMLSPCPLRLPIAHAGVVYGWDKECERDPEWAAAVQADPDQPFYHVLPDEGDDHDLSSQRDTLSLFSPALSSSWILNSGKDQC